MTRTVWVVLCVGAVLSQAAAGSRDHCVYGVTGENQIWAEDCGCSQFEDAGFPPTQDQSRIIFGWEVRFNELPYQVLIENRTGVFAADPICGAVMINTKWVLTSAKCVADLSLDTMQIVLGEHRRQSSNIFRLELNGVGVYLHPDYQPNPEPGRVEYNDIALVELEQLVPTSLTKYPICPPPQVDGITFNNTNGIICGWGSDAAGANPTNELRCTYLDFIERETCQSLYPDDDLDTNSMFCTFTQGRDVCGVDRGGPLAVKIGDHFHIVGIASWSPGCASGPPSVFMDVNYYYDWIWSVILARQQDDL